MRIATLLAAALSLSVAAPALAADLGYRNGTPYEDPRYSDIYSHPAPPRYAAPYPPPPVYRDDHRYAPPPYATQQYVPPYRNDGRYSGDCLPRQVMRDRLESRGWHDFHDPQVMGNVVHVRARRPNGRLFDVTLDRCTGEVLAVEAIDSRAAEAPPPDWRYRERPYGRY